MHVASIWGFLRRHYANLATVLFDLFFLWVIVRFGLGGWERAIKVLPSQELKVWGESFIIVLLTLMKTDFRDDVPLYLSAIVLAYWGGWWRTTRGL